VCLQCILPTERRFAHYLDRVVELTQKCAFRRFAAPAVPGSTFFNLGVRFFEKQNFHHHVFGRWSWARTSDHGIVFTLPAW
jgi:hypothetical protein